MPTPLDLIKEGIQNNDMDKVAQGYESLTGQKITIQPTECTPVIEVKKVRGRKTVKEKVSLKTKKEVKIKATEQPTFNSEEEYIQHLLKIEEERKQDILNNRAGPATGDNNKFVDYEDAFKDDIGIVGQDKDGKAVKVDAKKAHKTTPRREALKYMDAKCAKCNKDHKLPDFEYANYNWNLANQDAQLPVWTCGC